MSKCLWSVCVALAIFGIGSFESVSLAKPPDLPVELGVDFEDFTSPNTITLGFDFLSGKLCLNFTMPWNLVLPWQPATTKDAAPCADGAKQNSPPCERGTNHNSPPCEGGARGGLLQRQTALQQAQARALFATAERCLKKGDLDMARTCYEEAHLLAPETREGRQAIARLIEIDNPQTSPMTGPAEEQDSIPPTPRPRD